MVENITCIREIKANVSQVATPRFYRSRFCVILCHFQVPNLAMSARFSFINHPTCAKAGRLASCEFTPASLPYTYDPRIQGCYCERHSTHPSAFLHSDQEELIFKNWKNSLCDPDMCSWRSLTPSIKRSLALGCEPKSDLDVASPRGSFAFGPLSFHKTYGSHRCWC